MIIRPCARPLVQVGVLGVHHDHVLVLADGLVLLVVDGLVMLVIHDPALLLMFALPLVDVVLP